jgi:hypothetical protein
VPDFWEDQGAGPWALAACAPRGADDHGVVASVNVLAERTAETLDERAAVTLTQQRVGFPGFVLLDHARTELAGRPAVRTLFTYHLDGHQIVVDQWLVVADGIATVVSGGTDTTGFSGVAQLLEAIAASLELPTERPEQETSSAVPDVELPDLPLAAFEGTEADLLDAIEPDAPRLELRVGDASVLAWRDRDEAAVLAPEPAGRAVLTRMPAALLPVELATRIPASAAADERSDEPIELPPGVLAAVIATREVPAAVLPGPARDRLRELAAGLGDWWRLERHADGREEPLLEGVSAEDGPWRIVAAGDEMRLEPIRPRELFAALCAAVA